MVMMLMWTFNQNDRRNTDQAVHFKSLVTSKSLVLRVVTPKWCRGDSSSPDYHLVFESINLTLLSGLYVLPSDKSCMQSRVSDVLTPKRRHII